MTTANAAIDHRAQHRAHRRDEPRQRCEHLHAADRRGNTRCVGEKRRARSDERVDRSLVGPLDPADGQHDVGDQMPEQQRRKDQRGEGPTAARRGTPRRDSSRRATTRTARPDRRRVAGALLPRILRRDWAHDVPARLSVIGVRTSSADRRVGPLPGSHPPSPSSPQLGHARPRPTASTELITAGEAAVPGAGLRRRRPSRRGRLAWSSPCGCSAKTTAAMSSSATSSPTAAVREKRWPLTTRERAAPRRRAADPDRHPGAF